ncbi:MAG: SDR family NAD(P)-dependent oxidoreductase [Planctomycetes bacterium]|nr:SDR family NAD(P)-dependent oxidoreductase [Planctomycetota bacterium]
MSYWRNKVVLVTGGSAGLGRAIAHAFSQRGAKVIIAARNQVRLTDTVNELRSDGKSVTGFVADVTNDAQVESLVAKCVASHDRLDVLVNNVGRSTRAGVLETKPADFAKMMDLNFLSVVRCTRAAMPHLIQSSGHLINIGSLAAKTVSPYSSAYSASKHAVAAYSHQLRFEGPRNVDVLLVCPGPIARQDAGERYDDEASNLPDEARKPGGGTKLKSINPQKLASRILRASQKGKPELVVPSKTRLYFAIRQLWPSMGDWILRKWTQ